MSTELAPAVHSISPSDLWDAVEVRARLERLGFSTTLRSAAEIAVIVQTALQSDQPT